MDTLASISRELTTLAKETEETAIGSSRVEMYRSIAARLREQAEAVRRQDDASQQLLLEAAGLLTMVATGRQVPNLRQQASELLDKIGIAMSDRGGL